MTTKEKIILAPFAAKLVNKFGYDNIQVPSRDIAKILGDISYMSVIKYLNILEKNGYLTIEKPSRKQGNVYKLKKGRINRLIEEYNASLEIKKIFFNV